MPEPEIFKRPYLDSSVFIALIKDEVADGVRRGQIAQNILHDAQNGRWPIYTSTFTLAEVYKERGRPPLTQQEEQQIDAFFKHDYIKLVTLDRLVAEHARNLARQHRLSPADAVHVASAIRAKADELLVWDHGFPKTTIEGVRITDPYWFGQERLPLTP